jgi:hypothetical protein
MSDDPTRRVEPTGPPTQATPPTSTSRPPAPPGPPGRPGPVPGGRWEPWQVAVVAALVLLIAVLAGVLLTRGGDDDGGGTASGADDGAVDVGDDDQTEEPEESGTTTTSTTTTSTTEAPTTAPPATEAAGDVGPQHFSTPTGNIGCFVDKTFAECDIDERDWEPPPAPPDCDGDWGHGISVSEGEVSFVCAFDTALGAETVVAYGQMVRRGEHGCRVQESGVTCVHLGSGRGFMISRDSYRII